MKKEDVKKATKLAVCAGCPHYLHYVGDAYCRLHVPQGKQFELISLIETCERWGGAVNQLRITTADQGMGLLITPIQEDGNAKVELYAGDAGVIYENELSKMFDDTGDTFVVVPSYRIFNDEGVDVTEEAMMRITQRAMANKTVVGNPFSKLR